MIEEYDDRKSYRISRGDDRDDGICITLEGNKPWYPIADRVRVYRLYIDYNTQENKQMSVVFRDDRYERGFLELNILNSIKENLSQMKDLTRHRLERCLVSLEQSNAIILEDKIKSASGA